MKKEFCYEYPRPAVTTDCVVFCFDEDLLKVLLIRRRQKPYMGKWAIPGGFLEIKETAEEGAVRELREETGIKDVFIEQFHSFSDVDRDPRGRTISIAFYSLLRVAGISLNAGDDASEAGWFDVLETPPLAFDHDKILAKALAALRIKFMNNPVAFELLPEKFTIPDLQKLYEIIFDRKYDRRNFRKKFINTGLLIDLEETEHGTSHRGARLYMFDREKYEGRLKEGAQFDFGRSAHFGSAQ